MVSCPPTPEIMGLHHRRLVFPEFLGNAHALSGRDGWPGRPHA